MKLWQRFSIYDVRSNEDIPSGRCFGLVELEKMLSNKLFRRIAQKDLWRIFLLPWPWVFGCYLSQRFLKLKEVLPIIFILSLRLSQHLPLSPMQMWQEL